MIFWCKCDTIYWYILINKEKKSEQLASVSLTFLFRALTFSSVKSNADSNVQLSKYALKISLKEQIIFLYREQIDKFSVFSIPALELLSSGVPYHNLIQPILSTDANRVPFILNARLLIKPPCSCIVFKI